MAKGDFIDSKYRKSIEWSLAKALEAVARGGLHQNALDRRTHQIAACRRALAQMDQREAQQLNEARIAEMKRLREVEHLSLQEIGQRQDPPISRQRVAQMIGAVGFRKLTPLQARVLALRHADNSTEDIAKQLGKSYHAVWGILDRIDKKGM